MHEVIRRMPWRDAYVNDADPELFLTREWLLTNGLGGYASGTIAGTLTRRYHGLLIAALPAPLGRVVMLNQVGERVHLADGTMAPLTHERPIEGNLKAPTPFSLTEFRLENGLPVWRYSISEMVLERRILVPHMQNSVYVTYRLVSGATSVQLELRPLLHFRTHSMPVSEPLQDSYNVTVSEDRYEISASSDLPPLHLCFQGAVGSLTV